MADRTSTAGSRDYGRRVGVATDDFTIGSACRYLVEEMNLHCDDTGGFHCRYPSSGGVD